MSETKTKELFEQAESELKHAEDEINRPMEDVVSYSACVFSRRALYKYLNLLAIAYSNENNDTVSENQTIEELVTYCGQYNDKLKDVDFSSLHCRCDDMFQEGEEELVHCTSVDQVNYCTNLAEEVREILVDKFK